MMTSVTSGATRVPAVWISASLGGYALMGGLLTLLGWALDIRRLTDWNNSGISQMPNNALGVLVAGAAVVLLSFGRRRAGAVLGAVAGLIGAATLSQYLTGIDLGIDRLLVLRDWGQRGTVVPGRMGPPGCISLALIGLSIILSNNQRTRRLAVLGGLLTVAIAMLSIVGYLFGADTLYTLPKLTTIALQTATMLLALGLALVISIPERQPMRTLLRDGASALLVKHALPGVVLLPILLGWLSVRGQQAGLIDAAFGTALLVLGLMVLLTAQLWWSARAVMVHETALRQEQERLSVILGSITDSFMTFDAHWRFVFLNEQVATRLGKRRSELIGQNIWEVLPDAVGNEAYRQLHRAMSERISVEYEVFYPQWQLWFAHRGYPTADGGLAVYSRDITDRKQAEETVRDSERQLRLATDYAPVLIAHCDTEGRYKFVNKPYAARFGLHPKDVIGQRLPDVIGQKAYATFERHVAETLAGNPIEFEVEIPYQTGGTQFMRCAYMPERDGENVVGFVAAIVNITDRKRAEERLREAEEKFRTLADNIPQLAWIADAGTDGQIHWFNQNWYEYTGTTLEQMKGQGWHAVHHPDHAQRVINKFAHHVKEGLDWEDTFPLRGKDGQFRWFLSRMKVIRDESGAVVRIFGTNTDITEQRAMADLLRQQSADLSEADRRKNEFLSILAHELRNPLAPIRNGLQVLKLAKGNAEAAEQSRVMMERQLAQMVRLIDDLMDVSRISRGKVELRKERVELAKIVQQAVETSRPLIEAKEHNLTVAVPPRPIIVDADVTRLTQVLANLLNNAAKYSEPCGHITLTAERQGSDAVVSVKDTGVGIPADMLPKVFDLFTQVDQSLEKSQGGLGIGLSLVRGLVEMHGGSVEARSEGQGKGSEFIVRLPVDLAAMTEANPPAGDDEPACPSQRCRILVADDNADAATTLSMLLTVMGNEVRTANDGLQAVNVATEFRPDVILLDIGMPKLNGYEACRRIRQEPWAENTVLIALTGWGQEDDRRQSRDSGFHHHLVKPVDPAALNKLLIGLQTETA